MWRYTDRFASWLFTCILCRSGLLVRVIQINLLFAILAHILALFRSSLAHLYLAGSLGSLRGFSRSLLYRDLSTHQDRDSLIINLIHHGIKQVHRFQLVNQQRVFLLVTCILHGVFQLVQLAQVFFPCFVDDVQQDGFLE